MVWLTRLVLPDLSADKILDVLLQCCKAYTGSLDGDIDCMGTGTLSANICNNLWESPLNLRTTSLDVRRDVPGLTSSKSDASGK